MLLKVVLVLLVAQFERGDLESRLIYQLQPHTFNLMQCLALETTGNFSLHKNGLARLILLSKLAFLHQAAENEPAAIILPRKVNGGPDASPALRKVQRWK